MKYSIVIPTYNEGDYLLATVDNLLSTSRRKDTEIIIVDDGSTDNASTAIRGARVIRYPVRQGVNRARHIGATAAAGDWIVSIDAHTKFPKDWQRDFERVVSQHFGTGYGYMFGPTISYGPHTLAGVRFYGDEMDVVAQTLQTGPHQPAQALSGACQILRKNYYQELGGFDRGLRFPGRSEDMELSLRVWLTGGRCVALREIEVWTLYRDANYDRIYADEICNALRIYTIYFDQKQLAATIEAHKDSPGFAEGLALLLDSDVFTRKAELRKKFTRTFSQLTEMFNED